MTAIACTLLGHKVDHTRIAHDTITPCARCGAAILDRGSRVSRVAHTLSCFFGWHHYIAVGTRAAHNEYVCERCGHPLLFESSHDPYSNSGKFRKKVDYVCGLLGHRVHVVTTGPNTTEYACRCGHPFIKNAERSQSDSSPADLCLGWNFVTVNQTRGEWTEFVCLRCGHPFCFKLATHLEVESNLEQRLHA